MFYQGPLQEGISMAVGQQKMVLCFVTNENQVSQTWENDYLQDDSLRDLISQHAVALRMMVDSEEAKYLAQIFPLPQTPTIVIMKHGELKEYIAPNETRENFIRRMLTAFDALPPPEPLQEAHNGPPTTQPTSSPSGPRQSLESNTSPPPARTSARSDPPTDSVARILAERAARLQAEKEEAERRAKQQSTESQARAQAEADSGADTQGARSTRYAQQLRRRRQQELDERKRILKRIEDDKEERRQRAAERDRMRIDNQRPGDIAASLVKAPESKIPSTSRIGDTASIQVRLSDGTTIRSRFKSLVPFSHVRKWVDQDRTDGHMPYTFRQVLTPQPNQAINETEENKTLSQLGLAPSATLILIPVPNFSSAYEEGPRTILTQILGVFIGLFTSLMGLFGFRGSQTSQPKQPGAPVGSTEVPSASSQEKPRGVRGFSNPDDRPRDHQLYNGNSLNFEPRPEEQDDE
ncbi:hypothetical protein CDD82_3994 [Ophiocordyceps australis]|uniref:UBX domain-containing protein 2 n=1 Tax=Ophiocordyceps australis TaxID=1399860 RepID=A0A2C5Z3K8_9HYPO|nr:hypothetical protein CDD82_3994 [Ophiocordyceps australis]